MGMWQGDAKHGSAVLVTLDGLYIEGCLNNNKMMVHIWQSGIISVATIILASFLETQGQCIMLLEDGTSYEGEVAGVGVLGGKGVLRLPNGDAIQGTFHGSWADGIKMNATLTKSSVSSATVDKPLHSAFNTGYYSVLILFLTLLTFYSDFPSKVLPDSIACRLTVNGRRYSASATRVWVCRWCLHYGTASALPRRGII